VLAATVLGSALDSIDGTVVNIALAAIGHDLDATLEELAWIVTHTHVGCSGSARWVAGDHFGRRRIFVSGVVWFTTGSCLCAAAPNPHTLIAAPALQGVALLTPGSLAILQSAFCPQNRTRAIGVWPGVSGPATAGGPFLGGWPILSLLPRGHGSS
jgi:MFS family permease